MRLEHELIVREMRRAEDEYDAGQNRIVDEMFAVDNEMQKLQEYLDDIIPESLFPDGCSPVTRKTTNMTQKLHIKTLKEDFSDEYPKLREASYKLEQLYLRAATETWVEQLQDEAPIYKDSALNSPLQNAVAEAVTRITSTSHSPK